jgi:hypothetical protein
LLKFALKIVHLKEAFGRAPWAGSVLELALRIAIVGLILSAYLRLRSIPQLPLIITGQSALLTTQAVQSILLATIASCALAAEGTAGQADQMQFLYAWILFAFALATVVVGLMLRRKFLFAVNGKLQCDPNDANGLGRWQVVTIQSMVLAMSIALYGFTLRMVGNTRTVAWPFFVVSVALLFSWGPHQGDGNGSLGNPLSNQKEAKSRTSAILRRFQRRGDFVVERSRVLRGMARRGGRERQVA